VATPNSAVTKAWLSTLRTVTNPGPKLQ
jgi:hypothetical protein